MALVRCFGTLGCVVLSLLLVFDSVTARAWERVTSVPLQQVCRSTDDVYGRRDLHSGRVPTASPPVTCFAPLGGYEVKLAYGTTFGTSTDLDYATLEVSKSISRYPAFTFCGPAMAEVQVAMLASYVVYSEGTIERVKRLDYHDGFELGWIPKGKFTFPAGFLGMAPYLESGAGMSYVSETYCNSGSRWNLSFIGGFGLEKWLPGQGKISLGVQWRHMSNGNMWGEGDELHNSNSGTDMIQGLATVLQRF